MNEPAAQLCIGTYAKAGGQGLYPLTLGADGSLQLGHCIAAPANASFGVYSATHDIHYLVDECDSRLGVWRRHGDDWQPLATCTTGGKEPYHLALDANGGRLVVANYASGSLALFALDAHGLPIAPPASFQDSGTGPVKGRQDGPHLHCVRFGPEGDALYAVDLGADHVLRFMLDEAALGGPHVAYRTPAGSGPRHLLLHPRRPFALLLSELASTLTLLAIRDGRLEALAVCSTLPAGWSGDNLGGHLEWPSTGRAYVSNRGHDSLALIEVDLESFRLTPAQHISSGGRSPRHFLVLEQSGLLVAAHEKDGTVTSFTIDDRGRLVTSGQSLHVPGSCFVFNASGSRP